MKTTTALIALACAVTALCCSPNLRAEEVAEVVKATAVTEPSEGAMNVAVNKNPDEQDYPLATSNSEYNGLKQFAAMCAINGNTDNTGHGRAFPSWGPHKRDDLWFKIQFGKTVEIEKIVIYVRADFTPYRKRDHDSYWKTGTLEFSDGTKVPYELSRTADGQEIKFPKRQIEWIRITDLVPNKPLWCAFTEVQAWGK